MLSRGEGRIEVEDGFTIWCQVVGDGDGAPLLALHGGPGAGHDYIDSLADLAIDRPVVFYDQLGCGRSDQPDDPARWVIERFTREIDVVRSALGLDRVHLLGALLGRLAGDRVHARGAAGNRLAGAREHLGQHRRVRRGVRGAPLCASARRS